MLYQPSQNWDCTLTEETKVFRVIFKPSFLDYYILNFFATDGIIFTTTFSRAKKLVKFISEEQSRSNEVVIKETTTDSFSRTALVFGDEINLNWKYISKVSRWMLLCSIYKQITNLHFTMEIPLGEDLAVDLFRLEQRYKDNYPNYFAKSVLSIGLLLYFEMYCGSKVGSNFYINDTEITGILNKRN